MKFSSDFYLVPRAVVSNKLLRTLFFFVFDANLSLSVWVWYFCMLVINSHFLDLSLQLATSLMRCVAFCCSRPQLRFTTINICDL